MVKRTKGVCRFLETACRELPGFEYFQNSGSLVGAKPCQARNSTEIWPRFFCLGGESEHCITLSWGGRDHAREVKQKVKEHEV